LQRTFYDLGKAGLLGPADQGDKVDFHFDETRTLPRRRWRIGKPPPTAPPSAAERREAVRAQMKDRAAERNADFKMPNGAEVKACGGG
jgi:anaerobic magnesium-protoporphyrin IX monomethyl ester cyclase